jgi:hypothetical protein
MPKPTRAIHVGDRFERLTVVQLGFTVYAAEKRAARVRCECGEERLVAIGDLLGGHTRSCSCLQRERAGGASTDHHGESRTPNYIRWKDMLRRCQNPSYRQWPEYGGRGITVDPSWQAYAGFRDWINGNLGPCPSGSTLDRIDNDGPYAPGNVRWATYGEQRLNQRKRRSSLA